MGDPVRPWLSEEHFRLAVDLVEDRAMSLLDPNGIVRTWNIGAERINGYRADQIVGHHFGRLFTEEDVRRSKPELTLQRAAEQGRLEEEGWRLRADGSRFWARVRLTALHDDHRELIGFARVAEDLGARGTTHARHESTTAQDDTFRVVRALLEHTLEPTILTDMHGTAFLATAAAERLLGVNAGFFTRRPLINVVARQDTRPFRAFVNELAAAGGTGRRTTNVRMRARNGEVFVANVCVNRFQGPQGPALHWRLSPVS